MVTLVRLKILSLVLLMIAITGCSSLRNPFCAAGEGVVNTQAREIGGVNSVKLDFSGQLYVSQGTSAKLEIQAEESLLPFIQTRSTGKTLILDLARCIEPNQPVTIQLTLPKVKRLVVGSSGDIFAKTALKIEKLNVVVSGSGNIELDVETQEIVSEISGAGDIRLSGMSQSHETEITGSGKIFARDLKTQTTLVEILGSGEVDVNVKKRLKVEIRGTGTVRHLGQATVESSILGTGKVEAIRP